MHLSNKLIEEFRALHLKKYSKEIDYNLATMQLNELAELVRICLVKESIHA